MNLLGFSCSKIKQFEVTLTSEDLFGRNSLFSHISDQSQKDFIISSPFNWLIPKIINRSMLTIILGCSTNTYNYTSGLYSLDLQKARNNYIVRCAHTVLSFTISHCRTHTRTQSPLVSPGKISTVSAKNGVEQMASEWLKPPTMVPTTSLSFCPTLAHADDFSLHTPLPVPRTPA